MNAENNKSLSLLRYFSGSIARRLTVALVILGISATLITTAIQTYREYLSEIDLLDARFEDVQNSHGKSLAASIWILANKQIEIELLGLLNTPGLEYAEIRTREGDLWTAGSTMSSDIIVRKTPIVHSNFGVQHTLGTLTVVADQQQIFDRIKLHALESLLYFGTWTFFLAGALFLISMARVRSSVFRRTASAP